MYFFQNNHWAVIKSKPRFYQRCNTLEEAQALAKKIVEERAVKLPRVYSIALQTDQSAFPFHVLKGLTQLL